MTKHEMASAIAAKAGVDQTVAKQIVQLTLDGIVDVIATAGRVELRDFGVFHVRMLKPRMVRSPWTGTVVSVPGKPKVRFKASNLLAKRLGHQHRRTTTAYHEAGHALIFLLNGVRVRRIDLYDDAITRGQHEMWGEVHIPNEEMARLVGSDTGRETLILSLFAGPIAQAVYEEGKVDDNTLLVRGDNDEADKLIIQITQRRLAIPDKNKLFALAYDLVKREENWRRIGTIASALLDNGFLTDEQISGLG